MKSVSGPYRLSRIVAGLRTAKAVSTLCYVTIVYWLVGVDEEYYRVTKGNIWGDLQRYSRAIANYEKALKEREAPVVRAAVGWCYAQLGKNDSSVYHYRLAYEKSKSTEIAIGLALAEYSVGNVVGSRRVFEGIIGNMATNYEKYAAEIEELRRMLNRSANVNA